MYRWTITVAADEAAATITVPRMGAKCATMNDHAADAPPTIDRSACCDRIEAIEGQQNREAPARSVMPLRPTRSLVRPL